MNTQAQAAKWNTRPASSRCVPSCRRGALPDRGRQPRSVAPSKVNFNAKNEYEYIKNFKALQATFSKLGLDKHIEVERLIKGRYQDNSEFLQWMKRYYDIHTGGENAYNAVDRRKVAVGGSSAGKAASGAPPLANKAAPSRKAVSKAAPAASTTGGTRKVPVGKAKAAPAAQPDAKLVMENAELNMQCDD